MLRQQRQRRRDIGARRVGRPPFLEPRNGLCKAFVADGFQQVIHRRAFEGLHRVLVVGGDEDDMDLGLRRPRDVEAAESRHPDVEECNVRRFALEQRLRLGSVGGNAGNHELGPQRREPHLQVVREPRLVIRDDRRDRTRAVHGNGMTRVTRAPTGALSSISSRAAAP